MQCSLALASVAQGLPVYTQDLESAFCITLYNESWTRLSATLGSLVIAIESARVSTSDRYAICIVADGRERLSECTRVGFEHAALMVAQPDRSDGVEFHVTRHIASQLFSKCQHNDFSPPIDGQVDVVLCIKDANRGKLDSHRIFFDILCTRLSPKFCYQIDAGSILSGDAVTLFRKCFNEDPALAAVGPCIVPDIPALDAGLLQSWQYHDFAMRQATLFPLESSFDFLSVLPGQASAVRWSALQPGGQCRPRSINDPLWAYLHGIAEGSSFRGLMYLSEDRVLGAAIVLDGTKSWRLKYVPEAQAITDACESLDELLRQRRRWMNSSMICRIWLLQQAARVLALQQRALSLKLKQVFSILLQALVGLREFTAPAQLVAILLVLVSTVRVSAPVGSALLIIFGVSVSAELVLVALETRDKYSTRKKWLRQLSGALAITSFGALAYGLAMSLPTWALAIAILPALLTIVCMSLVLPSRAIPVLVRAHFSPIQHSALYNFFLGYALWNMHDASWGTKGLTRSTESPSTNISLFSIRRVVLVVWVLVNALLIAAASLFDGFFSGLNPVVEGIWMMDAGLAVYSLLWLFARRTKRK